MKAVIFDCDGVLIDSERVSGTIVRKYLCELGFDISEGEVLARCSGHNIIRILPQLESDYGIRTPENFVEEYRRRIWSGFETELEVISGVAAMLDGLENRRAVASNARRSYLTYWLERLGLINCFGSHIYSAEQVKDPKPAPDVYLYAAGQLGADVRECVVVEDSLPGVTSGCAAGMTVIGFTGGGHCPPGHGERLLAAGASAVLGDMADLPRLLETLV